MRRGRPAPGGGSFFPMAASEKAVLLFLILFSTLSFLPLWLTLEVAGVAVFGWLMAALMLISPALTLVILRRGRRGG